ncbi:MAG: single-stranded-DNA-specific exonuclease RecJ [Gammaproteobacteria bacterium]|nr:single-stranded-DNA-specific exonuclease RecJ [Gammaproteobacteria bacterium]MDH5652873.1 single-stranded-DNA-specific exonuclease RecJ [Gammaproteobacteria bacterium]
MQIKRRQISSLSTGLPPELHPVLQRVYAARQVTDAAQLEHNLKHLLPWQQLKDIDRAVALLVQVLRENQRILIIGDFDSDGATSSALAVKALQAFGAQQVDFLVPNRFEYGYGLTPEIVEVALTRQPDLIITVDNGISSLQGVAVAKQHGVRVLITDHHLPADQLPAADAIVNPNQPGDTFPGKSMAGVGVIFYVMMALRAALREQGWFEEQGINEPNLATFLDLVALGTVADVVPLDYNNRILVAQGLARIRAGQCCHGIAALLTVSGRSKEKISTTDIGFCVAPRLNAAGRLDDMSIGISCLLSETVDGAMTLARELDHLNRERREIEQGMREQAFAWLETQTMAETTLPVALCLYEADWHEGVIGILAARVKDKWHRPVIAFAATDNGMIKGSARSIPGLHIRDALDAVAAHHPGLITKFGGHAMAAGLTIAEKDFPDFRQAFCAEVARHLSEEDLQGQVLSDGELHAAELTLELAENLREGGPWGQGFPEPVFDGVFEIINRRIVGEKHLKLELRPADGRQLMDAIAFNTVDTDWPADVSRVELAYKLDVNEFQGVKRAQLLVEHIEPV